MSRTFLNYGRKKSYEIGPRCQSCPYSKLYTRGNKTGACLCGAPYSALLIQAGYWGLPRNITLAKQSAPRTITIDYHSFVALTPNCPEEHSSLFWHTVSDEEKRFLKIVNDIRQIHNCVNIVKRSRQNKLECLFQTSYFNSSQVFVITTRAYPSGAPYCALLAFDFTHKLA